VTRGARLRLAVALSATLALALVDCGGKSDGSSPTVGSSPSSQPPFRFFSPDSFWNRPLEPHHPIARSSRGIVTALEDEVNREIGAGVGPWINTTSYSVPIYTVPRRMPTVPVHLVSPYRVVALRRAFAAVPLPSDAEPAAGNDAHLVVWQPSTDQLWEFWHLSRGDDGWQANWGGAIDDASESPGAYDSASWPGATPLWGASASSLSIAGGLITLEDLRRGRINHALSMSVPEVRAGFFSLPARRTDGSSFSPASLPEGAELRLPANLDLAKLDLPPLTRLIAQAAQRYGIFIRDRARTVCFYAQAPHSPSRNPYAGSNGLLEGRTPLELLRSFPWRRLQLLPMRLRHFGRGGGAAGRASEETG
jgi:hypothetical protein